MAECEWAILCDYAFQDVARKTCAIGIFDRVFAAAVPAQHHQAAFVFKLIGDAHETVDFRVDITRPTGGLIGSIGGRVTLPDAGMADIITNLQGMPLPDYGVYTFALMIGADKDSVKLAKPVTVTVTELPAPKKE